MQRGIIVTNHHLSFAVEKENISDGTVKRGSLNIESPHEGV